jgi:HAD superfamily hydrolase (TIGR01549 family)
VAKLSERQIEITPECAQRAFQSEIAYYLDHHLQGTDARRVKDLQGRCARVLHAELPLCARERISPEQLVGEMLECLRFTVYPEVLETLARLRERAIKLVVVSNWDVSLHALLRSSGLERLLDGALTSAEVGQAKPASEIFRAALTLAGTSPEQTMHVGDSLSNDVQGALSMGITPVFLRRRESAERVPPGVRVIYSLSELLA